MCVLSVCVCFERFFRFVLFVCLLVFFLFLFTYICFCFVYICMTSFES